MVDRAVQANWLWMGISALIVGILKSQNRRCRLHLQHVRLRLHNRKDFLKR